jgi:hypothetical protein
LKACTFGTFVAKEIEELGLSLPHSDLSRLSSMHYPSYARALRRDYRDSKRGEGRGRLLLLMLEMSLKGESSTDIAFVESLLNEMVQLHLPRTLLMATERLCGDASRRLSLQSILRGSSFRAALVLLSSSIASELRRVTEATEAVMVEERVRKASETVSRLGTISVALRSIDTDWLDETRRNLTSLVPGLSNVELLESLRKVVLQLDRCMPPCSTEDSPVDKFMSVALQRLEGTMTRTSISDSSPRCASERRNASVA